MSALTELLRCPHTGERLVPASPAEIARTPLPPGTAAVVNENRRWLYRVEQGIPVLLPDEAIRLPAGV